MKCVAMLCLFAVLPVAAFGQNSEQEIRAKTKKFTDGTITLRSRQ